VKTVGIEYANFKNKPALDRKGKSNKLQTIGGDTW